MKLPKLIVQAVKSIKGVKIIDTNHYILATTPSFNIRVLEREDETGFPGDKRWVVQFGYKPTFDRWANSVNFETEIWYSPKKNQRFEVGEFAGKRRKQYLIPNLNKEIQWCKKVATSGLFDWNSYFATVKTPWFIYS